MTIIEALVQLRNDLKLWVTNNLRTKVDKEDGKMLSSNDFTTEEKEKLAGLSTDGFATTTYVDEQLITKANATHTHDGYLSADDIADYATIEYLDEAIAEAKTESSNKDAVVLSEVQKSIDTKVDKEDGKGLSSNDFTDEEKEKLASIDMGNLGGGDMMKATYDTDGDGVVDKAETASFASSASSATKATKDGSGNTITSTYETKTDAIAKLDTAKEYTQKVTDAIINGVFEDGSDCIVAYAGRDGSGNVITSTYATIASVDNKPGVKTEGMTYTGSDGSTYTCGNGEIFNYYGENIKLDNIGHPDVGNVASGNYSHAEGNLTNASGNNSHAEGQWTIASGMNSHAEGSSTIASGINSHAEGISTNASGNNSHAEGQLTNASGDYSHAEGYDTKASGVYAHAEGYKTIANAYQHASGKYNAEYAAPATADTQDSGGADALFVVGYGTSTTRANAFRISSNGKCRGTSAFSGSGADFAELFEWADGNPNNEDRRGLFVTLEGEKIRLANADDDYIGVISSAQAFIGNSASEEWQGKYLTDVFGTKLSQEIEVSAKIDEKTGEVITPARTTTQYIVNPDYDPNEKYIMRENRKEWGIVGLLGQVVIIDDGTCVVGGYAKPSTSGVGTTSDNGYRVMKRIDDNHIKVLVK